FERDRARVLHSAALRRLAGKTQVVGPGVADFPRTRLTHSLECAQIGREIAGDLGADPDLVDAACLAHDLGHPPFGHNGEIALDAAARDCGGFEGNAQSLRVLTRLEAKVFDEGGASSGLNLTRATLDAATKYPWPRGSARDGGKFGVYEDDLPVFAWLRADSPGRERCVEAQIMDWSDDVAYSVHDLEDGVVAGLIDLRALAGDCDGIAELAASQYSDLAAADIAGVLAELLAEPWWPRTYDGTTSGQIALKAATTTLIGRFCRAAENATRAAHGDQPLRRYAADLVVPRQARAECAALKAVTARYVMSRPGVLQVQERERQVVGELVDLLAASAPEHLEPAYAEAWLSASDDKVQLRVVVDQVAGLTDAAAAALHFRLSAG
ncbi:MAG: dGTPase, partial [Actinomycetota bacterium]|nr:dGTPase [Actinomycetota bacterium]